MKRLFTLLCICLPIYLFAQGFGSFSHDQPFFSKDRGNLVDTNDPGPSDAMWVSSDITSNNPVSVWLDRMYGIPIIQTNDWTRPTNDFTKGLTFDGSKWMFFSNYFTLQSNSTVFVICHAFPRGNIGTIVSSTNLFTYIRYGYTNGNLSVGYENNVAGANTTVPINPTNQLNVGFTAAYNSGGNNEAVTGYTNGVSVGSVNTSGGVIKSYLESVGSYGNIGAASTFGRLDMMFYGYIKEILIWTNKACTSGQMAFLNTYANNKYGTNIAPFRQIDSTNLWTWMRGDNPYGNGALGANNTNGARVQVISNSKNPSADSSYYFEQNVSFATWQTNIGTPTPRPGWVMDVGNESANRDIQLHSTLTRAQPTYYFFVIAPTNTVGNSDLLDTTAVGRQQHMFIPGSSRIDLYAGNTASLSVASGNYWLLLTTCFNGTSSWARTNGLKVAEGLNTGTDGMDREIIGDFIGGGFKYKGLLAEYINMQGSGVTTNDIQNAERYLSEKYGITYLGQ